jgi:heme exporter protein CcmD
MTHLGYIAAAYAATALALLGAAAWVAFDLVSQRRRLDRLEEEGFRRRTEARR